MRRGTFISLPQTLETIEPNYMFFQFLTSAKRTMTDEITTSRREIARIASEILAGSTSAIMGARQINALRFGAEIENDPDITPFVAVDSETDALPVDPKIRKLWSPEALERLQGEIDRAETWAAGILAQRCKRLISRFGE